MPKIYRNTVARPVSVSEPYPHFPLTQLQIQSLADRTFASTTSDKDRQDACKIMANTFATM